MFHSDVFIREMGGSTCICFQLVQETEEGVR